MNKEESMQISAAIGTVIAKDFPVVKYDENDVASARAEFTDEEIAELCELGLMKEDFEEYFVLREFCRMISLGEVAEGDYIAELFKKSKKLSSAELMENPYMKLAVPEVKEGNVTLAYGEYEAGEIFQYDMPDFDGRLVVPKLGFYTEKVRFPAIYEGNIPWVSVCPSEINSMASDIDRAHGKVLVLGLGLGYYAYMCARKENVSKVCIVEINEKIFNIFKNHVLPLMECRDKIELVLGDAIEYTDKIADGEFDFVYADIWEGAVDGAEPYTAIKKNEKRLPKTEFAYWIEPQIRAYLADNDSL